MPFNNILFSLANGTLVFFLSVVDLRGRLRLILSLLSNLGEAVETYRGVPACFGLEGVDLTSVDGMIANGRRTMLALLVMTALKKKDASEKIAGIGAAVEEARSKGLT